MASRYFLFINGDASDTANWAASRGGSGGETVPASNDDVFIEATEARAIISGLSGKASVDLNSLTISGPVTIDDGAGGITWAVSGTSGAAVNIKNLSGVVRMTAGTNGIDLLHVRSTAGNGRVIVAGGAVAEWKTGRNVVLDFLANATYTTGTSLGRTYIAYNSSGGTTLTVDAGTCECERTNATWRIGPLGVVTKKGAAAASTLLDNYGRLIDNSYGTIASMIARVGSAATAKDSPYPLTVTALTKQEGSMAFDDSPGVTLPTTITPVGNTAT